MNISEGMVELTRSSLLGAFAPRFTGSLGFPLRFLRQARLAQPGGFLFCRDLDCIDLVEGAVACAAGGLCLVEGVLCLLTLPAVALAH